MRIRLSKIGLDHKTPINESGSGYNLVSMSNLLPCHSGIPSILNVVSLYISPVSSLNNSVTFVCQFSGKSSGLGPKIHSNPVIKSLRQVFFEDLPRFPLCGWSTGLVFFAFLVVGLGWLPLLLTSVKPPFFSNTSRS